MKRNVRPRVSEPKEDDEEPDPVDVTQDEDTVYFYAEVSRHSVLLLCQALEKATRHALQHCTRVDDCTVYLYIFSDGGDAMAGLSAFDHIRNNRVPVTTVADGFVASAATFLLLGGAYPVAMKHSTVLIHQLTTGFWGKYADLIDEMHNSESLMRTISGIYAEHTKLSKRTLDGLLCKEKNMSAEECLSMGFVQELW